MYYGIKSAYKIKTYVMLKKSIFYLLFLILGAWQVQAQTNNQNLTLASEMKFPGQLMANICGYAVNGREYALVGGSQETIIVDVTNPTNIRKIVSIPWVNNRWKEIKTYKNYAYVTSEGENSGLQIIDLSALPGTSVAAYRAYAYKGDSTRNRVDTTVVGKMIRFHALHIDTTKGFCYLFGGNSAVSRNGALILDLSNPYYPKYAGQYSQRYIHDGYVDNDTLWAGEIYEGRFTVVDCRNKQNPVVLASQQTPLNFTHNVWLTQNRRSLLTTDERSGSFLASYDISNLNNIRLLDKIGATSEGSIVHNTHMRGDFAVSSWYRDGVTIVDSHRPDNLVQVGSFDARPDLEGNGFNSTWGVYPFLPSGNLLLSDIENGLQVLRANYPRACYLEGNVTDSVTRQPLNGVKIKIISNDFDKKAASNLIGDYKTGQVTPGNFQVVYLKDGYRPKSVFLDFRSGVVNIKNIALVPLTNARFRATGRVIEQFTLTKIKKAKLVFKGFRNEFEVAADTNGLFSADLPEDTYEVLIGSWGHLHSRVQQLEISNSPVSNLEFRLNKGYEDHFFADLGWEISGSAADSTQGRWVRELPKRNYYAGQVISPNQDVRTDFGEKCYSTGNTGMQANIGDLDGKTTLTSPYFPFRAYIDLSIDLEFSFWFMNDSLPSPTDSLLIYLKNSRGATREVGRFVGKEASSLQWRLFSLSAWNVPVEFRGDSIRLVITAVDGDSDNVTEVAIDNFRFITRSSNQSVKEEKIKLNIFPNPSNAAFNIQYELRAGENQAELEVFNLLGQRIEGIKLPDSKGQVALGENWPKGVYIVHLKNSQQSWKIVKE
jgi:choice-of-anchor B domain-containing protein